MMKKNIFFALLVLLFLHVVAAFKELGCSEGRNRKLG
jgi:hypothetical protein